MATRTVQLKANDGLLEVEITAKLKSSGMTPMTLTGKKLEAARALHSVARELGFNPLDIAVTDKRLKRLR